MVAAHRAVAWDRVLERPRLEVMDAGQSIGGRWAFVENKLSARSFPIKRFLEYPALIPESQDVFFPKCDIGFPLPIRSLALLVRSFTRRSGGGGCLIFSHILCIVAKDSPRRYFLRIGDAYPINGCFPDLSVLPLLLMTWMFPWSESSNACGTNFSRSS